MKRDPVTCAVDWLTREHTKLWYFAMAWQFDEWYDHVFEVYYEIRHHQLENQYREVYQGYEESLGSTIASRIFEEQIDLLDRQLDSFVDEGEQEFYDKKLLLDVWLQIRGIALDAIERDSIVGWTFNRFSKDA